MTNDKSSGIGTAIGLIILFLICAFLTGPLLIAGMMGASDNPNAHHSSSTQMLMALGLPALPWIFFMLIAVAALRKPKMSEVTGKPKPSHILNGLSAALFAVFLFLVFKVLW